MSVRLFVSPQTSSGSSTAKRSATGSSVRDLGDDDYIQRSRVTLKIFTSQWACMLSIA